MLTKRNLVDVSAVSGQKGLWCFTATAAAIGAAGSTPEKLAQAIENLLTNPLTTNLRCWERPLKAVIHEE